MSDNVKSIVEQRRAKIVSEYYDKILTIFDDYNEVKILEADIADKWVAKHYLYIPPIHHEALVLLLLDKGFHIEACNNMGTPIRFIITIEDP